MFEEIKYIFVVILVAIIIIATSILSYIYIFICVYFILPILLILCVLFYYIYERFEIYADYEESSNSSPWRNLLSASEELAKNDLPPSYDSVVPSEIPTICATIPPPSYEQVINKYGGYYAETLPTKKQDVYYTVHDQKDHHSYNDHYWTNYAFRSAARTADVCCSNVNNSPTTGSFDSRREYTVINLHI